MIKPLPDFETWAPAWQQHGWNYCLKHAADALDFLARYDRPIGGEDLYNAIDLESTAIDVRLTMDAMNKYREKMQSALDNGSNHI